MKIIYKKGTGEIVSTAGDFQIPAEGEEVAQGAFMELTKPLNYYRFNGSFITPRNTAEVDLEIALANFSFDKFMEEFTKALSLDRVKALGLNTMTLQWLVSSKSWVKVYEFLLLLVTDNDITEEEATKIKACFLLQGVDIDGFKPTPQPEA